MSIININGDVSILNLEVVVFVNVFRLSFTGCKFSYMQIINFDFNMSMNFLLLVNFIFIIIFYYCN